MPDFQDMGLWPSIAAFAVASVVVWLAGSRLSYCANEISGITGLGQAVMGVVLTSLPEIAVTATASWNGNAVLAVNNLIGSIALQVALLAVVDLVANRKALTAVIPEPALLLQGSLNILLIAIAAAAMAVGDVLFFGVGLWSWSLLLLYAGCVWIMTNVQGRKPWLAAENGRVDRKLISDLERRERDNTQHTRSLRPLVYQTLGLAVAILLGGYAVARSGEAIADLSGIGASFGGFVLIAFSTSLPELSSALSAARRKLYTMAISDILGTNLINIALLFMVDAIVEGEPVLSKMGTFAVFGALLAIILTAVFQAGLAERNDKSYLRMGVDSIAVLLLYVAGVVLLYLLRGTA
jgi:cation:H+ antiporter